MRPADATMEVTSDSVVLTLDDYAIARNTVLRVKDVVATCRFYPIKSDDRATGFLLPAPAGSTLRGQSLSNGFFWALGQSQDVTFVHDWFGIGQGAGAEYRYVASQNSYGNVRVYRLDQHQAEFRQNGQVTRLPDSVVESPRPAIRCWAPRYALQRIDYAVCNGNSFTSRISTRHPMPRELLKPASRQLGCPLRLVRS